MNYIIVSPDPDDECSILYLVEAGPDYCYWTRNQRLATRYLTYGHAKASAERRLPKRRDYLIRTLPSQLKGA